MRIPTRKSQPRLVSRNRHTPRPEAKLPEHRHGRDNGCVLRKTVAFTLVALLLTGCGVFTAPPPTAGDHTDIVGALVRRGMTVTTQVSGDPGCENSALHSNAVRYDVRPAGDTNTYAVYVFGWKSQATFDSDKPAFDACVEAHAQTTQGSAQTVEHLPWRAYGIGWPTALNTAVDAALTEAGGIPAPVQPE